MTRFRLALVALLLATAAAADPLRVVSLPANDLIYDPVTKLVYASVPSSAGSIGNTITAIDPETGQIGPSVPVGSEPGELALSDQGRSLYVALDGAAAVRRFDTVMQTAGLQFTLGTNYGPNYAEDLAVLPGQPDAVAVSKYNKGISPRHVNVTIYDNGVPRPKVAAGANVIAFGATAARLYGYHNETTDFAFVRWNVDASGIVSGDSLSLLSGFGLRILFDGGRIYATNGGVYDPEAGQLLGTLPGGAIRPDATLGRVFILNGEGANVQLSAFDTNTFRKLWTAQIPGVNGGVGSLIRWGADGLAFRSSGGQVFLLHTGEISVAPLSFSLALSPTTATGAATVAGTIALSAPAPSGGATVLLSSSDPAAATVPPQVLVPAGATTAAFPVVAHPVAAAEDVTISATSGGVTDTATLHLTPPAPPASAVPAPAYDPANGHWYQEVRLPSPITWPDAKVAAAQLAYAGFPGHLAAITSAAENQFVSNYMTAAGPLGDIWIGGYQDLSAPDFSEPAGGWRWITGEPWSYTSWSRGEPNNGSGGENELETNSGGTWNDLPSAPGVTAYLVEYEPPAVPVPGTAGAPQLALFPNPVPGGLLALGQVILPQPAGPGGVAVSLTSSSPAVALVPASVVVLPGAGTVTFPIITFPVAAPTSVTITASSASGPVAAMLQVLPLTASVPSSPSPGNLPVTQPAAELPAPTNLTARLAPGPAVQLTWQDNSSDENAFAVWRRTGSSDWVRIAVLAPNTTTFLDPNGAPGTSYTYRVRATRGNVASDWSNEASVTTS